MIPYQPSQMLPLHENSKWLTETSGSIGLLALLAVSSSLTRVMGSIIKF